LKNGGWETAFPFGTPYFSGAFAVSFREFGNQLGKKSPPNFWNFLKEADSLRSQLVQSHDEALHC